MQRDSKDMIYLSYQNTTRNNLTSNNSGYGYSVDGVSGRGRMAPHTTDSTG